MCNIAKICYVLSMWIEEVRTKALHKVSSCCSKNVPPHRLGAQCVEKENWVGGNFWPTVWKLPKTKAQNDRQIGRQLLLLFHAVIRRHNRQETILFWVLVQGTWWRGRFLAHCRPPPPVHLHRHRCRQALKPIDISTPPPPLPPHRPSKRLVSPS